MKLRHVVLVCSLLTLSAPLFAEIVHTPSFSNDKNQTLTENKAPQSDHMTGQNKQKA